MNIEKHIAHWREGSDEDFQVARDLVESERLRHGLFFLHLALEKMLKAHVAKTTGEVPPKIHNLVTLAGKTGLSLDSTQLDLLREFNLYQLEGRYPEHGFPSIEAQTARTDIDKAAEILEWLKDRLQT